MNRAALVLRPIVRTHAVLVVAALLVAVPLAGATEPRRSSTLLFQVRTGKYGDSGEFVKLCTVSASGGVPTGLGVSGPLYGATWSPSGDRVAYARWEGLYIVGSDGGVHRRLTAEGVGFNPSWSPTGAEIAAVEPWHSRGPETGIVVIRSDRSLQRTPRTIVGGYYGEFGEFYAPTWSPDGRRVAYAARFEGSASFDLFAIQRGGGRPRRLTTNAGTDLDPAWSPDGRTIAFTSNRDDRGIYSLYLLHLRTGRVTGLTRGPGDDDILPSGDFDPEWSPDGRTIAFTRTVNRRSRIYVVNRDGSGVRAVTPPALQAEEPHWRPARATRPVRQSGRCR